MGHPQPHPYTHNTVDNMSKLLLIILQVDVPALIGCLSEVNQQARVQHKKHGGLGATLQEYGGLRLRLGAFASKLYPSLGI